MALGVNGASTQKEAQLSLRLLHELCGKEEQETPLKETARSDGKRGAVTSGAVAFPRALGTHNVHGAGATLRDAVVDEDSWMESRAKKVAARVLRTGRAG